MATVIDADAVARRLYGRPVGGLSEGELRELSRHLAALAVGQLSRERRVVSVVAHVDALVHAVGDAVWGQMCKTARCDYVHVGGGRLQYNIDRACGNVAALLLLMSMLKRSNEDVAAVVAAADSYAVEVVGQEVYYAVVRREGCAPVRQVSTS